MAGRRPEDAPYDALLTRWRYGDGRYGPGGTPEPPVASWGLLGAQSNGGPTSQAIRAVKAMTTRTKSSKRDEPMFRVFVLVGVPGPPLGP